MAKNSKSKGRPVNRNTRDVYSSDGRSNNRSKRKKKTTLKDKLIIAASIIAGLIIVSVMVLNIPIIAVENVKDGKTYTEHISLLKWIKGWQPLVGKEGTLSADDNSYELNSGAGEIDDKRDFTNGQIIEGQFTVLCLGFDEDRSNSDVIMVFQFDINNDKINVLQIPRDCFVPENISRGDLFAVFSTGAYGYSMASNYNSNPIPAVVLVKHPEQVIYSYDKVLYPGEQVLNGEQAELFVRARAGYIEGDIGRVKAQRIFLAACMEKALNMGPIEVTKFLSEVYNKGYIATDLSLQEMSILSDFGGSIDLDDVTVNMVPGEAVNNYNGYSVYSIHKKATVDMLNKYFRPYQTPLEDDSLPIYELVESDYYTTDVYDENQDTLQDIADGATPGESKKTTESPADYSDSYYSEDEYGY